MGNIVVRLEERKAPITCENFLKYVKSGFYDGTIFHRVIKGFMIQGGGFTQEMKNMFARETGKLVVLPRTLLARVISELTDVE